jgi:hypothetical protein
MGSFSKGKVHGKEYKASPMGMMLRERERKMLKTKTE